MVAWQKHIFDILQKKETWWSRWKVMFIGYKKVMKDYKLYNSRIKKIDCQWWYNLWWAKKYEIDFIMKKLSSSIYIYLEEQSRYQNL